MLVVIIYIYIIYVSTRSFIVLKTSDFLTKQKFRDIEKTLKMVSLESHRKFNDLCPINDLLPTYTNIYIYLPLIPYNTGKKYFILILLGYKYKF